MNVGTLWAEIGLNTAKLEAGSKKAKAQITGLADIAKNACRRMDSHFNSLGIRSAFDIREQKQQLLSDFNEIKASGTTSARDVQQAYAALNANLAALDRELSGMAPHFSKLGIRSSLDIKAEKQQVVASFAAIRASGTASARDVTLAYRAMKAQLRGLSRELSGMAPHFANLGIRSSLDISAEKQRLIASFNAIKASGTASARDIIVAQRALKTRLKGLNTELRGVDSSMGGLVRTVKGFLPLIAAGAFIGYGKAVFDAGVKIDAMRKSMAATSETAAEAQSNIAYVKKEADRLGQALLPTSKAFVRLNAAAKGTKLAGQGVRKIFSAVMASGAKLSMTTEEMNGALLAISQMISKGTVSAEELRGQLGERLPGAFQVAARAMGVTTKELGEMLQKGEIIAEDFLPKFSDALNDTFRNTANEVLDSARANVNRLGNAWLDLKIAMADSGFMDGVIHSIEALTNAAQTAAGALAKIESFQDKFHSIPGFEHFGGIVKMTEQDTYKMLQYMRDIGATQEEINKMRREYLKMGIMSESGPASPHSFGYVPMEKSKNSTGKETEGSTIPEEADKVVKALQFELAQLQRNEEEQRLYNELKQAETTLATDVGKAIEKLVHQLHEEEQAKAAAAKVANTTAALQEEINLLHMNAEQRQAYLAQKQAGVDANSAEGVAIEELVYKLYMEKSAIEAATQAQKNAEAADKKRALVVDNLKFELGQLGRIAEQRRLYNELKKAGTSLDEDAGKTIQLLVTSIEKESAAQTKRMELQAEGKQLQASLRTETEKYADELERLNVLLEAEAISQETYNRALAAARPEAEPDYWTNYLDSMEDRLLNFDELAGNTLDNLTARFGEFFESAIFDSESLGDAFSTMAEGMARSVVSAIGEMIAQWLVYQVVSAMVGKSAASGGASALATMAEAASLQAGINAYSSTAAIPIVGPAMAPAAMSAAMAATEPMAAAVAALSTAAVAGMAHDGIDAVPATGTWLLEKGERVTTADTSARLDRTLARIEAGQGNAAPAQATPQSIRVVNVMDPSVMDSWANSSSGEKTIMNHITRNAGQIRQVLGG